MVNFVDKLEKTNSDIFSKNLILKEGLYIFLDIEKQDETCVLKNIDKDGNILKKDLGLFTKETEMDSFFEKCLKLQTNSIPVSPAKIFNPNKKIYNASCSPFALCFNKKNFIKYDSEILKDELENQYFKAAEKFINKENREQIEWFGNFKGFMVNNFLSFINRLEEFTEAKSNFNVSIFLKQPAIEDYIETHQLYLQKNVFNKDKFNKEIDNVVLGISDSLSGFNDKKRFLQHKTAPLEYNFRINENNALKIWKFFRMQKNNQLPNPMPVFIDKQELNGKVVSIYNDDRKKGFAEIIKDLFENHEKDLHNFYLIFFNNGLKGSHIIDLDFVPVFRYNIDNIKLEEVFPIGGKLSSLSIKNVFDFQKDIANRIFNNQLIQETQKGLWIKYFDDIEPNPKYHFTETIFNLMLKYRKSFYDFIYKSKRQAITEIMFDDIMINSILDDIKHDKEYDRGYSIKEKLNIWFSLYNFFNQNKKREDMASKIPELLEKCRKIANNDNEHLSENPEEFAFAAGQVIYFLLDKSKAANKTHALLEPFLQKTMADNLQNTIGNTIGVYKHAISFGKGRFERLAKEVLAYETDVNIKNLQRFLLAGYFAQAVIYEKK